MSTSKRKQIREHSLFQSDQYRQICCKDLKELESRINGDAALPTTSVTLARIKSQRMYQYTGADSFKEYLALGRINLAYSTAVEQARIGEVFLCYQEQLEAIGFCEQHGMKKLLHLEKALSLHPVSEVFQRLQNDSYRAFKGYAQNARAFCCPEQLEAFPESLMPRLKPTTHRVFEDQGRLYVDVKIEGRELLWFNKKFLQEPETAGVYRQFVAKIVAAATEFFQ